MQKVSVLIVDRHQEVREALTAALASQPEFVVVGSTGDPEVATHLAWFWEPDIILMDIRKLNGGGLADCQRIARASPCSRIVVLTSYLLQGERERCRSLGARLYLLKNIGLARLVEELKSIIA